LNKGRIRKWLAALVALAVLAYAFIHGRTKVSSTAVYGSQTSLPAKETNKTIIPRPIFESPNGETLTISSLAESNIQPKTIDDTAPAVIPPIPLLFELQELALAGADADAAIIAHSYVKSAGSAEAHRIADSYWNGGNTASIPELAVSIYGALWELERDKKAAYRLGLAYFHGRGVIADANKSLSYFEAQEIRNERVALYHRAILLADTEAAPERRNSANELLKRSAEMGYPPALRRLNSL